MATEVTQVITTVVETVNPEIPQNAVKQMRGLVADLRAAIRSSYGMGGGASMQSATGGIVPLAGLPGIDIKTGNTNETMNRRGRARGRSIAKPLTPDESLDYRKQWFAQNAQPFYSMRDIKADKREGRMTYRQLQEQVAVTQAYRERNKQLIAENKQLAFRVKQLEGNLKVMVHLKQQQARYKEWFRQQQQALSYQLQEARQQQQAALSFEYTIQSRGRVAGGR